MRIVEHDGDEKGGVGYGDESVRAVGLVDGRSRLPGGAPTPAIFPV
jgi:hypothetical protein